MLCKRSLDSASSGSRSGDVVDITGPVETPRVHIIQFYYWYTLRVSDGNPWYSSSLTKVPPKSHRNPQGCSRVGRSSNSHGSGRIGQHVFERLRVRLDQVTRSDPTRPQSFDITCETSWKPHGSRMGIAQSSTYRTSLGNPHSAHSARKSIVDRYTVIVWRPLQVSKEKNSTNRNLSLCCCHRRVLHYSRVLVACLAELLSLTQ